MSEWTVKKAEEALKDMKFACQGGMLENASAYIWLLETAAKYEDLCQ